MSEKNARSIRRCLASVVLFAAIAIAGCGESKTESAAGDASNTRPADNAAPTDRGPSLSINAGQPAADPLADKPLVVPENATPEELVEFLRTASATRILGKTEEEYVAKSLNRANVVLTVADRILATQTTSVARYEAAANKFNALQDLRQFDAPEGSEKQQAFAAEMPQIVDGILKDPNTDTNLRSQTIALKLNTLFTVANQSDTASDVLISELKTASADRDAAVVNVARQIDVHYRMARFLTDKERDSKTIVDAVAAAVSVDPPDPAFFPQLRDMVAELELKGSVDAAGAISGLVGAAYGRSDNEQLAEVAKQWAETVKRRTSVVGSEIVIDGMLADGQPFDWPSLRGKVVLIDFWATWCPPCLKLLPELEDLHARYREQGFEIVGVSLDNERTKLDQFLAERQLPWPILANVAGKPPTTPEKNAECYGIEAIPVVILVDKQGKAVATGLHGEELEERVKELLAE